MSSAVLDGALLLADRIHPLMGPIFKGRPSAEAVGEQCTMCLDPFPSDTAIIDRQGRTRHVCLTHEIMLQAAYSTDKNGLIGTDHYQAYVMEHIMRDAAKPWWMPAFAYTKLTKRASAKARLLALVMFLGMASPLRYAKTTPDQKEEHGNL